MIQNSFQQQHVERIVEQSIELVKKENVGEGNFAYIGGNGYQQGNSHNINKNLENDEDNDSINDKREYDQQLDEYDNNIGQVMHRVDNLNNQPEFLEQDEDKRLNEKIKHNNQINICFEEKNEQNIWNKERNSSFGGQENYGEDSNYFLAPQEKLSNNSSINNQEARELQMQPQQQHLLQLPEQLHKHQHLQGEQDLSDRNQQQQMLLIQQGNIANQSTGGGSSSGQQGNNYNNVLMQNSREKNQKNTAKKRKTTQTTLTINKLKKFDNSVPQMVQPQIQNQMQNRPRLGSESSNSNEALQLNTGPPAGNSKITEFFKKRNPSASSTPSVNNNPQNIQNVNQQPQQIIQVQQIVNNGQNNNNIKETINPQAIPVISTSAKNGQQPYQNSIASSSANQSVTSKKSNNGNILIIEENKTLVQNGIQNSNINGGVNSGQIGGQFGNNTISHQHQSTLKVSSQNQMMLVDPKLELKYNSLIEDLKNKDVEISDKNNMLKYLEHDKREIEKAYQSLDKNFSVYKSKVQKLIAQQLLENEKLKREELRLFIQKEKQRLGEYVQTRDCTKFDETWQQGTEFMRIKERIKIIEAEKEELERKKKNIKGSRKSTNEPDISQDLSMQEAKQRINLQIQFLTKEEADLVEAHKILEHEKFLFVQKLKRYQDEQNSRYGQSWPCLGERFQLLSLLGRGGFSEVYKAYDMVEFKEVACKIHQLNLNWSEQSKANYIKHAVRESKIHSELKHPNIVMLFDTVEIDNNSFATILEYCEGPDLYFYLKKHKCLPEKDAKMLIKQILCALKYMNSQKTRIIHYDLKPQNIIFHKGELKISDFGLSKIFEDGQTRMELTSQGVGTYWYLPPETFEFEKNAQISPKVDIWSVGVIFYELVFGQRPFGNNKSQDQILKENIILKSTQVNFPTKPNISNECKEFIRNCLTYDQNRRWDIQKAWDSPYMNTKSR